MKKLYFHDTGLSSNLMGFQDSTSLWNSPQAGALFENLVFSELTKTRENFLLDWSLFTWRTKDQDEIDFVLRAGRKFALIEAKLALHGAKPFALDREAKKVFPPSTLRVVATAQGEIYRLDQETWSVPVGALGSWLREQLEERG